MLPEIIFIWVMSRLPVEDCKLEPPMVQYSAMPYGRMGYYLHGSDTIHIYSGLCDSCRTPYVAHEMTHYIQYFCGLNPKNEEQAYDVQWKAVKFFSLQKGNVAARTRR